MKNKPPAFQFYPKDFLSDINVSVMSMEERGIYITLLSHCWLEGWLPNGSTKLQRICNYPSSWKKSWSNIKHCFYENGGKLYHKRLEEERLKQLEWKEKSRLGGIKSGESRRQLKGGSRVVEPKGNSSSSSSSSSSKKLLKHIPEKPSPKETELEEEFEEFWKGYKAMGNPKNKVGNKQDAYKAFKTLRKKISKDELIKALWGEADYLKHERLVNNFDKKKKYASTWLRSDRWMEHKDFKYTARL